jgi:hypothetical protein
MSVWADHPYADVLPAGYELHRSFGLNEDDVMLQIIHPSRRRGVALNFGEFSREVVKDAVEYLTTHKRGPLTVRGVGSAWSMDRD